MWRICHHGKHVFRALLQVSHSPATCFAVCRCWGEEHPCALPLKPSTVLIFFHHCSGGGKCSVPSSKASIPCTSEERDRRVQPGLAEGASRPPAPLSSDLTSLWKAFFWHTAEGHFEKRNKRVCGCAVSNSGSLLVLNSLSSTCIHRNKGLNGARGWG